MSSEQAIRWVKFDIGPVLAGVLGFVFGVLM
jgi:hypothetical protein